MSKFLLTAMRLIRKAMIARDFSERGIDKKSHARSMPRPGPLMTLDELNDL
jgi:hypothetical protein